MWAATKGGFLVKQGFVVSWGIVNYEKKCFTEHIGYKIGVGNVKDAGYSSLTAL